MICYLLFCCTDVRSRSSKTRTAHFGPNGVKNVVLVSCTVKLALCILYVIGKVRTCLPKVGLYLPYLIQQSRLIPIENGLINIICIY